MSDFGYDNNPPLIKSVEWCSVCFGQHGWYVMQNGDRYHNKEPGSTWTACHHCQGTSVEPDGETER
jgi:hypothetical protein